MKILYLPNEYSQQRQREKPRNIWPVRMAMEATYMRDQGHTVWWDEPDKINQAQKIIRAEQGLRPFLSLPRPDRKFTDALNPKYQNNGNFKYHPGTYIMAASGCWHGKCTFCVERGSPDVFYQEREVLDVVKEILICRELGFKEIFDDSATFPTGIWLDVFCKTAQDLKLKDIVTLGCNMRMVDVDYKAMKAAGFRMLLFGLESANQETLDKINKGVKVEDHKYIIKAAKAGLEPHVAVMFGYPWETDEDSIRTLKLVHWLLRKGYAKTAQASFYTTKDEISNYTQRKYINKIYHAAFYPDFWINKLRSIRNVDDIKYLWRQIKEGVSCLRKS